MKEEPALVHVTVVTERHTCMPFNNYNQSGT